MTLGSLTVSRQTEHSSNKWLSTQELRVERADCRCWFRILTDMRCIHKLGAIHKILYIPCKQAARRRKQQQQLTCRRLPSGLKVEGPRARKWFFGLFGISTPLFGVIANIILLNWCCHNLSLPAFHVWRWCRQRTCILWNSEAWVCAAFNVSYTIYTLDIKH